jgi:glycosyltransferase involved in cell wall biosynthesis
MGISIRDVTVIVPTRGRKDRVGTVLSAIKHPADRVMVVVDDGRQAEDLPANMDGQVVVKSPPKCGSIKAWETGVVAAQTSHVLLLNDDIELEPDCIENAIRFYNERFPGGDGVVGLNHGEPWKHIACFALMPKRFYMEHCYPSPYRRYCVDNEFTEKAKFLGLYDRAEDARLKHDFPPHDEEAMRADWQILNLRMEKFLAENRDVGKITKVFMAIPIFNAVDVNFFGSVMKFVQTYTGVNVRIAVVAGDSLVPRARNTLTVEFLKSDCTHLLFVDSDLVFDASHIVRMLSHDEDIVGGFYPKKQQGDPELVFNAMVPPVKMDSRRLTQVRYIGTGFILVKRHVIEKMVSELGDQIMFEVDGKPGTYGFDFWPVGVYHYPNGTSRYLSEDWYFCQRAIDLGFKIYGDNGVILKHSGSAVYPLKTQEEKLFGRLPSNGPSEQAAVSPPSPPCEAAATVPA